MYAYIRLYFYILVLYRAQNMHWFHCKTHWRHLHVGANTRPDDSVLTRLSITTGTFLHVWCTVGVIALSDINNNTLEAWLLPKTHPPTHPIHRQDCLSHCVASYCFDLNFIFIPGRRFGHKRDHLLSRFSIYSRESNSLDDASALEADGRAGGWKSGWRRWLLPLFTVHESVHRRWMGLFVISSRKTGDSIDSKQLNVECHRRCRHWFIYKYN